MRVRVSSCRGGSDPPELREGGGGCESAPGEGVGWAEPAARNDLLMDV